MITKVISHELITVGKHEITAIYRNRRIVRIALTIGRSEGLHVLDWTVIAGKAEIRHTRKTYGTADALAADIERKLKRAVRYIRDVIPTGRSRYTPVKGKPVKAVRPSYKLAA